jgi:hypothetical protein
MLRTTQIWLAVLVMALGLGMIASATSGDVKGRIVSVDPEMQQFTIKTASEKNWNVQMDEDACVIINNREAQFSELLPGDQADVVGREHKNGWLAVEVRVNRH